MTAQQDKTTTTDRNATLEIAGRAEARVMMYATAIVEQHFESLRWMSAQDVMVSAPLAFVRKSHRDQISKQQLRTKSAKISRKARYSLVNFLEIYYGLDTL